MSLFARILSVAAYIGGVLYIVFYPSTQKHRKIGAILQKYYNARAELSFKESL